MERCEGPFVRSYRSAGGALVYGRRDAFALGGWVPFRPCGRKPPVRSQPTPPTPCSKPLGPPANRFHNTGDTVKQLWQWTEARENRSRRHVEIKF
jgi:hypothetical protein